MNYVTFSPSKRIRPLLLLESNLIFSAPDADSYILASALELVHTYSLVHDDLPCMDDDDLRRGVKTLHKVKNEAYAVLVGDALLTRAFEILSFYSKKDKLNEVLRYFTLKSGYKGMIFGQELDIEGENKKLTKDAINKINKNKTCALIELALICGAINGNAGKNEIKNLEYLGEIIGFIFQLQDDILDITGNTEILGKATGSDEKNKKSSLPLLIGIEKTKKLIYDLKDKSFNYIEKLKSNKKFFYDFIEYLTDRKK
jgi:geranylgeranyl diphosphate synthase, type II